MLKEKSEKKSLKKKKKKKEQEKIFPDSKDRNKKF